MTGYLERKLDSIWQIRRVGLECLQLLRRLLERSGATKNAGGFRMCLRIW